jgi:hypothetical protein
VKVAEAREKQTLDRVFNTQKSENHWGSKNRDAEKENNRIMNRKP